nr:MAG TPA: nucelotide kinase [Caudoviricetes sp.]
MKEERVNHPSHYNHGKLECIDIMEDVFGIDETRAFCKLNAFKYLVRAELKGSEFEDIDKALWYLNKHQELLKKQSVERIIDNV